MSMRLATWVINPSASAEEHVTRKIAAGEVRGFAVQGSLMNADIAIESVAVDMLMSGVDANGDSNPVWEPVMVQGQAMALGANYNHHSFTGPLTLRFRKSATAVPVGVSDFES